MGAVMGLTFLGVFALVALLLIAFDSGSAKTARQAVASLDSAIRSEALDARKPVLDVRRQEQVSSIPWLNRKLRELELTPRLRRLLEQARVNWTPGRLLAVTATCFAIPFYIVYLRFGMFLPALAAGVIPGALPYGWILWMRGRRFAKFEEGLPDALDLMVSALRAGHSLIAAMGLVSRESPEPVSGEFKICFEEQNYGLEMKTALDNLTQRMPLQDLRMVATAILIQRETGGNLAEVLDKTSHLIRDRFRLKRQVKVHTAQGRLTGWVLTCVPLVLGAGMYMVNPRMISVLWERPIGIKLLWAAGIMMAVGGFVISRIVDVDV